MSKDIKKLKKFAYGFQMMKLLFYISLLMILVIFIFLFKIIKSIFSHNKFKSFAAFDSNHYSCRYFKKAGNNPIKDNDLPLFLQNTFQLLVKCFLETSL